MNHAVVKYHDTDFGFLCPLPLPVFLEEDKGPDQQDEHSIAMPTLFLPTASESAKLKTARSDDFRPSSVQAGTEKRAQAEKKLLTQRRSTPGKVG